MPPIDPKPEMKFFHEVIFWWAIFSIRMALVSREWSVGTDNHQSLTHHYLIAMLNTHNWAGHVYMCVCVCVCVCLCVCLCA